MRLTRGNAISPVNDHFNIVSNRIHTLVLQNINGRGHQVEHVSCVVNLSTPVVAIRLACMLTYCPAGCTADRSPMPLHRCR